MLSLHQLRCFLTTYEHGSLTAPSPATRLVIELATAHIRETAEPLPER